MGGYITYKREITNVLVRILCDIYTTYFSDTLPHSQKENTKLSLYSIILVTFILLFVKYISIKKAIQ